MSKIEAVVFDMDGVLIDTRELITQAFAEVLASKDLVASPQALADLTGKPIYAQYEILAAGHDARELERLHLAHHEENLHLIKDYGAAEVLEDLQKQYKLGIFTGFNELSKSRLDLFDLSKFFEVLVDTTQYEKHKPDPEGLLLCISKLGTVANKTVYIGDAISDIRAGKAAGVQAVIGVTHGFGSRADFEEQGANYVIDSLLELPELIEGIA